MELDPELELALGKIDLTHMLQEIASDDDIARLREWRAKSSSSWGELATNDGITSVDHVVPSESERGGRLLRVHSPAATDGLLPCLFHVHGGGMVSGTCLEDDGILLPIVQEIGCICVSPEYRLAPEHRGPAAAFDCYESLRWVFDNAHRLGVDPARIVIGGTSGGGGIAASTAILARDRGGPQPCFQWLRYPQLDDRNVSGSSRASWVVWTREMNVGAWRAVLGDAYGTDDVSPYQAASRAADLHGLPTAYIEVGAMEVFRDECVDYARRLLASDVDTELHVYAGAFHGFDLLVPEATVSRRARTARMSALRSAMAVPVAC